jgi:hypothetical protein
LLLDFDTKHWEARLAPGEGQTQVLVLRNMGKGLQKALRGALDRYSLRVDSVTPLR